MNITASQVDGVTSEERAALSAVETFKVENTPDLSMKFDFEAGKACVKNIDACMRELDEKIEVWMKSVVNNTERLLQPVSGDITIEDLETCKDLVETVTSMVTVKDYTRLTKLIYHMANTVRRIYEIQTQ